MRYKGKIITWKDEKGFGFVTYDGSPDKVFVHINSFLSRSRRPVEGDQITFEVELDEQRRSKAILITYKIPPRLTIRTILYLGLFKMMENGHVKESNTVPKGLQFNGVIPRLRHGRTMHESII